MRYDDLIQPDNGQPATPIHIVDKNGFASWLAGQPDPVRTAVKAQKFEGSVNDSAILPGDKPGEWSVVAGVADASVLGVWNLAKLSDILPEGSYRLLDADAGEAMLGWVLGQYRYHEYLSEPKVTGARVLLVREPGKIHNIVLQARATALVRDLVNRPAGDLGPDALEAEAKRIAKAHKADVTVTAGEALEAGFPLIHAVGKAAAREHAPRLIELEWGDPRHPRIAIVGKGITFDSGGLDMKPASGMRLMKKDMGGAAHALALAELIMSAHLPVRLHMLVAAAENSISGNAMRPGDIVKSRKGITVEIDNTDAEGRLVLADVMWYCQEKYDPRFMVDLATLTGAIIIALGHERAGLFSNDDTLATHVKEAGSAVGEKAWRMPLGDAYDKQIKSDIADMKNVGGRPGGSITAAQFIQRFVNGKPWAHLDIAGTAWSSKDAPTVPKGATAYGVRMLDRMVADHYEG